MQLYGWLIQKLICYSISLNNEITIWILWRYWHENWKKQLKYKFPFSFTTRAGYDFKKFIQFVSLAWALFFSCNLLSLFIARWCHYLILWCLMHPKYLKLRNTRDNKFITVGTRNYISGIANYLISFISWKLMLHFFSFFLFLLFV